MHEWNIYTTVSILHAIIPYTHSMCCDNSYSVPSNCFSPSIGGMQMFFFRFSFGFMTKRKGHIQKRFSHWVHVALLYMAQISHRVRKKWPPWQPYSDGNDDFTTYTYNMNAIVCEYIFYLCECFVGLRWGCLRGTLYFFFYLFLILSLQCRPCSYSHGS